MKIKISLLLLFLSYSYLQIAAEEVKTTIKIVEKSLITYAYNSPKEYMLPGRLYPYYRFDQYSSKGEKQKWEMIEMENPYIKAWICPAIGGKLWGAIDKKTGKEFIYFNHVVKFRDVASRGPWTSGGIETNFGIIGHAPWASSQVDYQISHGTKGEVICTVGGLDISLGTHWRVQYILPTNKAFLESKVLWYNKTKWDRPFYQWMNAGIKTEGNLHYIYPGDKYLTHDGKPYNWDIEKGHKISKYEQNNFGHYKSYHVIGKPTNFWGAYWEKDKFGMAHVAPYEDKLGKKIWIWGLSRYGMVWEDLLTDKDGQYTEVQSGKLFNQCIGSSYKTPFKHYTFIPGTTYSWREYWMPINKIGLFDFCSTSLAYKLEKKEKGTNMLIYAISPIKEKLKIISNDSICYEKKIQLNPTTIQKLKIPIQINKNNYSVFLGKKEIYSSKIQGTSTQRPTHSPKEFNYNSAYGLFLQGKEFERQNFITKATSFYRKALQQESFFIPALSSLAGIYYEQGKTKEALTLVKKALSINTYDDKTNYLFGLISKKENNESDLVEAFSVAIQSPTYKSVAAYELALFYTKKRDLYKALKFIQKDLNANPKHIAGIELKALLYRMLGEKEKATKIIKELQVIDPLNFFAKGERYLLTPNKKNQILFQKGFMNEFWATTCLSTIKIYEAIKDFNTALKLLSLIKRNATIITYHKAYLLHLLKKEKEAISLLEKAEEMSPSLIFPHQLSDIALYKWVNSTGKSKWKANFFLSMIYFSKDRKTEAKEKIETCKDIPYYYAFYLTRAMLFNGGEKDFLKAIKLAPNKYVCYLETAKFYLNQEKPSKSVNILERYYKKDKNNSYINLLLAKAYLYNQKYKKGIKLMKSIKVLPNEGSLEGRNVWRETNIRYAIYCIKNKEYSKANKCLIDARIWPENLGVGKPYADSNDERLENFLQYYIEKKQEKKEILCKKIAEHNLLQQPEAVSNLFTILARKAKSQEENKKLLVNLDKQYNQYKAIRWSKAILNKKWEEAALIAKEKEEKKVPLPFEIIFDDRDFFLILSNYDFFIKLLKEYK